MAARHGVQLPVIEMTLLHYRRLIEQGHGDEDISTIFRLKTRCSRPEALRTAIRRRDERARRGARRRRAERLPAGLLPRPSGAHPRAGGGAAGRGACARTARRARRVLDRTRAHLRVPALDGPVVRRRAVPLATLAGSALARRVGSGGAGADCAYGGPRLRGRVLVRPLVGGPARRAVRALPSRHWAFLLPNLGIAAITGALTLRYFYVAHEWKRSIELEHARASGRCRRASGRTFSSTASTPSPRSRAAHPNAPRKRSRTSPTCFA